MTDSEAKTLHSGIDELVTHYVPGERFERFDHDLILFRDISGSGFTVDTKSLRIIGGRSASSFTTLSLIDLLELSGKERAQLSNFLQNSEYQFWLLGAKNKTLLILNRLFSSCGLGVAVVFNVTPKCASYAISEGLFAGLNNIGYSKELISQRQIKFSDATERDAIEFSNSLFKVVHTLMATVGAGPFADVGSENRKLFSVLSACADIIGCHFNNGIIDYTNSRNRLNCDSLAALTLCGLSLCRNLSTNRMARIEILRHPSEITTIRLSFSIYGKIDKASLDSLDFYQVISDKLEIPLSVDLTNEEFIIEFAPLRSDPSLCGLKAGIRFNDEKIIPKNIRNS